MKYAVVIEKAGNAQCLRSRSSRCISTGRTVEEAEQNIPEMRLSSTSKASAKMAKSASLLTAFERSRFQTIE